MDHVDPTGSKFRSNPLLMSSDRFRGLGNILHVLCNIHKTNIWVREYTVHVGRTHAFFIEILVKLHLILNIMGWDKLSIISLVLLYCLWSKFKVRQLTSTPVYRFMIQGTSEWCRDERENENIRSFDLNELNYLYQCIFK